MKDMLSAATIIGIFLLMGLMFDGCVIAQAIHEIATSCHR